jgi:hypothetical protein
MILEEIFRLFIELACWPFRLVWAIVRLITSPIRWIFSPFTALFNAFVKSGDRSLNREREVGKIRVIVNTILIIAVAVLMLYATIKIQQFTQLNALCAAAIGYLPSWLTHSFFLRDLWPISFLPDAALKFLRLYPVAIPPIVPVGTITYLCQTANQWGVTGALVIANSAIIGCSSWIASLNVSGLISGVVNEFRFRSITRSVDDADKLLKRTALTDVKQYQVRELRARLHQLSGDIERYC